MRATPGTVQPPATADVALRHEPLVDELVEPVLGWAVVHEDVHTAIDLDLEWGREEHRT